MTTLSRHQRYYRTQRGLIARCYHSQSKSSRKREHTPQAYSLDELYAWATTQMEFFHLFNAWVASDYDIKLKPSFDRLDDSKPYTFSNLQITTWEANYLKSGGTGKDGIKYERPVNQLTLEGIFITTYKSATEAANINGFKQPANICSVCNGRQNTSYNYKWEYT